MAEMTEKKTLSPAMRHTIKSVIVMVLITIVAVGTLAAANALLPKYQAKLDLATVAALNKLCPTGVADQTALDDGYFAIADVDDAELAQLIKDNKEGATDTVYAVYLVKKGAFSGGYIVESMSTGFKDREIVMLTSFSSDKKITSALAKKHSEDMDGFENILDSSYFSKLVDYLKSGAYTQVDTDEIMAETGATTKASTRGVVRAINLASKVLTALDVDTQFLDAKTEGGSN